MKTTTMHDSSLAVVTCLLSMRANAETFTSVSTMAEFVLNEDELIDAMEVCYKQHVGDADDDVSR